MVIESLAFVRGHREDKRLVGIPLLISFPFCQIQRGQRGIEMKVKLLFAACLTVGEPRELFCLSKDEFNMPAISRFLALSSQTGQVK